MSDNGRFFRGNELPKLLLLLGVALGGWTVVYLALYREQPEVDEPERAVAGNPEPIKPDESLEFQAVRDRTVLKFRENAAYKLLLERARAETPDSLAKLARRDVLLPQLAERPAHYRGVPIHILGYARRVLRYESKLAKGGWLYEAWVFTPDSQNFPYVCVFEDVPPGFPIGNDVHERIVFNGYFLKLMAYGAGDTAEAGNAARLAPLLVGRIGWTPSPQAPAVGAGGISKGRMWLYGGLAIMFVISMARWIWQMSRFLSPRGTDISPSPRPTEVISPDELTRWVESNATDRVDEFEDEPRDD